MQITIGNIRLSLTRSRRQNPSSGDRPTFEDISRLNDNHLRYIRSLSNTDIRQRLDSITVVGLSTQAGRHEAADILRRNGIVVVSEFIPRTLCTAYRDALNVETQDYITKHTGVFEDDRVLFQPGASPLKGYAALAGYSKPVINVRQGQDEGMIDIFNADRLVSREAQPLRDAMQDGAVLSTIGDKSVEASNFNTYINTGITHTRGFHVDSYGTQLKAFLYLTDVLELDNGPYVFVKQSPHNASLRRMNRAIASGAPPSTEAPVLNPDDIVPVLAPEGSLVISDQCGIHRGFPQSPAGKRAIAVMNYK